MTSSRLCDLGPIFRKYALYTSLVVVSLGGVDGSWLDKDTLEACQTKLLGAMPNTYTFTKGLAETLVKRECRGYPVAIVRPSIVVCSWKEPFPVSQSGCLLSVTSLLDL